MLRELLGEIMKLKSIQVVFKVEDRMVLKIYDNLYFFNYNILKWILFKIKWEKTDTIG